MLNLRNIKVASRLLVFAVFSFFIFSCQTPQRVSHAPHLTQKSVKPEFLLNKLMERKSALIDLKSFVKATVVNKKSKRKFKQVLLLKGDHSIRIDTMGIFGRALGVFVHNKQSTLIYDVGQNRSFKGAEAWRVMSKVVGTTVDFGEYISLLSGNIPRLKGLTLLSARLGPKRKYYILDFMETISHSNFEVKMDGFKLIPVFLKKRINGREIYKVHWQEYQEVGNYPLPHKVAVSRATNKEELTIELRSPVINSGIPAASFHFKPPEANS